MDAIPKEHMEFIEKLIQLAKEYGCSQFSLEMRPGFSAPAPEFHHSIKASWTRGRHNAASKVLVQSEQWEYLDV